MAVLIVIVIVRDGGRRLVDFRINVSFHNRVAS
jgi:hypothetical protein